ncbi:replication endonuclease [Thalassolituus sp. UBA2009]|uniref:replication endonuclease n=1 Tax=Thalassolituus sp. UBA2009 TaxID=1947658 RepID=UPI0025796C4B|nr:replication endonuclease [Thalassolituus sp. UBA2009]
MSEFALVGAPAMKKTPYWERQAAEVTERFGEFSRPLLNDWKRVVSRAKSNGIRNANQRLDELRKQFKIGDFLVHQTHDQYLEDYITVRARSCILKLTGWPDRMTTPDAVHRVFGVFEHHGFEDEVHHFNQYEKACVALEMTESVLNEAIDQGGIDGDVTKEVGLYEDVQKEHEKRLIKVTGLLKRCQDENWWRRKMRRAQAQRIEKISRELNQVVVNKNAYCSPVGRREWQRRQQMNLDMLEHTLMENEDGEQYTLADLSELSVANPVVRRAELMVRIAGFEEYAKANGYEGWFYTITTPSKYHSTRGCGRNPKFRGASPRDGQQYMCSLWARFRTLAGRITRSKPEKWDFFGFRVAEPHHDGTPHWHLLLFVRPDQADEVTKALRGYAEKEDHHELLNAKADVRFKAEKIKTGINPKTGKEYSAAGYIAKYIAKNIDGEHVDKDLYGKDAKASAKDIVAWSSRNGIRQFQQVGGPSVTVWRQLRRLARLPEEEWTPEEEPLREFIMQLDATAQESASAAWKTYCEFYDENGLSLKKILKTVTETMEYLDEISGEQFQNELTRPAINAYGETGEKIIGVIAEVAGNAIEKISQWRSWFRVNASKDEAFAVRQRRKAEKAARDLIRAESRQAERDAANTDGFDFKAAQPPWTGVNNCTGQPVERSSPPPQQLEMIENWQIA